MSANTVQKIGKYEVTEVLGQGGMGIVYKAVDPGIGRKVAIKMMTGGFAENPDLLKRFQREAQSAGTLQHPNIVIIYELGTHENGNPYMAMEFIDGESLETLVQSRRRMSLVDKIGIMIQMLNGLQYAHAHGIVHRDIKPGNIMLLKDGTVKIVDFGIARIADNSMTKTGQIVGTINYMSPEQFNGHVVDGRSDIFSSGVLLYEFLTSTLPFDGAETPTVILKILNDPPPPLKDHLANFPPELEECVRKALAKDREERYASAEDFAFDLARIQESLKKEMVVEYVEQAKEALGKRELNKAKDLLQQVLKVDTKNLSAQEIMKDVQAQLSVQQRGEQIRQLRSSAEDALAQKMLDEALSFAEQALKLDKANPELLQLQKMVTQARARKEQLTKAIRKAEDLRQDGDYEAALKTADEAVTLDPKDTSAKNIREQITAEIRKLQSQRELAALLDEARKAISARHFTAALALIRKSESVAPGATQAGSLRNVVNTAREQEALRVAIDNAAISIEIALHRDPMPVAQQKLEQALKKFPGESSLTELAENATGIRQAAGLGDAQKVVARAQALLQDANFEPAIALLEHAVKAAPDEGLKSMLSQARRQHDESGRKITAAVAEADRLFKAGKVEEAVASLESQPATSTRFPVFLALLEKTRAEQDRLGGIYVGIIEARKQAEKGDVTGAFSKAKALLQSNPASQPLQQFLKELEGKRVVVAKETVEKALKEAKVLLMARQATAATRTLQGVAQLVNLTPPELQRAYATLQKEITAGSGTQQAINADMNATIVAGSTGRGSGAAAAPATQKTIVAAPQLPVAKPFPMKQVGAVALVLALAVGGYFGYQKAMAPPPIESYVEINATPWATVTSVVSADGKYKAAIPENATPVRVLLPAGDFVVTLAGPDGKSDTKKIKVSRTSPAAINQVFEGVSANEIVQTSN